VLGALCARGGLPDGFVLTLPKAATVAHVEAMAHLCARMEDRHDLASGVLRFEVQVETTPAVLGSDGTATVARMVHAAPDRCVGLHYGTYDYGTACGVAPGWLRSDHPAADLAKGVMQVVAAGTGVRVCDGSLNVLPVGGRAAVHEAWRLHAQLVRRALVHGFYQGWDLHPAQLVTRFAATFAFFREGLPGALTRLSAYAARREEGVLDEPATAEALARFLLRALDCGAVDAHEVGGFDRVSLEALGRPR